VKDSQDLNSIKNYNESNLNHKNSNSHFNNYKNSEPRDKFTPNIKNISTASTRDKSNSSKFNNPLYDNQNKLGSNVDSIED